MHEFLFWIIASLTGLCAIATVVTQNIVRAATWLLFTLAGTSGIFFLLGADLVGAIQLLVYVGGTLILVVFGVMLTAQGPFINMKTSGAEYAVSMIVGMFLMGVLAVAALSVRQAPGESYTLSPTYRLGMPTTGPTPLKSPLAHPLVRYAPEDRMIRLTQERLDILRPYKVRMESERDPQKWAQLQRERDEKLAALDAGEAEGPPNSREAAYSPYTNLIGQGLLGRPVGPAHSERTEKGTKITRAHYLFPFEIVSVHLLVVLIGAAYLARAKRRKTQSPLVAGGPEVQA